MLLFLLSPALGFPNLLFDDVGPLSVFSPARIVLLLLIAHEGLTFVQKGAIPRPPLVVWLLGGFVAFGIITTLLAIMFRDAVVYYFALVVVQMIFNLVAFCALIRALRFRGGLDALIAGFVVSAPLQLFVYLTGSGTSSAAYLARLSGFFENPNSLAAYCSLCMAALLTWLALRPGFLRTLAALALVPAMLLVINATGSRSGAVAILILLAGLWFVGGSVRPLVIVAFAGGVLAIATVGINMDRFTERSVTTARFMKKLQDAEADDRIVLLRIGLNGLADTFPMGAGMGQTLDIKNFARWAEDTGNAMLHQRLAEGQGLGMHNTYMSALLEYGVISFCFFVAAVLLVAASVVRALRSSTCPRGVKISIATLAVPVALWPLFHVVLLSPVFWTNVALLYAMSGGGRDRRRSRQFLESATRP